MLQRFAAEAAQWNRREQGLELAVGRIANPCLCLPGRIGNPSYRDLATWFLTDPKSTHHEPVRTCRR